MTDGMLGLESRGHEYAGARIDLHGDVEAVVLGGGSFHFSRLRGMRQPVVLVRLQYAAWLVCLSLRTRRWQVEGLRQLDD